MSDSNNLAGELQVAEYMEEMQEDSEENYNKHFSQYIAAELEGGDLEEKLQQVRSCCFLLVHAHCNTLKAQLPLFAIFV